LQCKYGGTIILGSIRESGRETFFPNPTANLGGIRKEKNMKFSVRKAVTAASALVVMLTLSFIMYGARTRQSAGNVSSGEVQTLDLYAQAGNTQEIEKDLEVMRTRNKPINQQVPKETIAEAVKEDGYAVLNADDKMIDYLLKRTVSKTILFSSSSNNQLIVESIRNKEKAVFIDEGIITIFDGTNRIKVINIDEIPITYGGMVDCNIENSLAAVASLHAMNVPAIDIKAGLSTFKPDIILNPGRFNIFNVGNFKVMLDYGHNQAGYNAVINFAQKMKHSRLIGVIGVPGDRQDRNIKEIGQICSKAFSKLYIKEDSDLRGRKPGEVANILFNSLIENDYKLEDIKVIRSELKALETAILDAQPEDMIIMLYEQFEPAVELVNRMCKELEENSLDGVISLKEPLNDVI
jgi:cyanophycin synthetase